MLLGKSLLNSAVRSPISAQRSIAAAAATVAKPRHDVDGRAPPPLTQLSHDEIAFRDTGQFPVLARAFISR